MSAGGGKYSEASTGVLSGAVAETTTGVSLDAKMEDARSFGRWPVGTGRPATSQSGTSALSTRFSQFIFRT